MKPWNEKQFKYEKLFIQLENDNTSQENSISKNDIGQILLILISICKDTNSLVEEEKEKFWTKVEEDINQLEQIIDPYFQN